jgi:hypothetical protein
VILSIRAGRNMRKRRGETAKIDTARRGRLWTGIGEGRLAATRVFERSACSVIAPHAPLEDSRLTL